MEDAQIVDLYWNRDEAAIHETDTKYGKMLRRISMNILADNGESEECVNDTYLKAWNSMPPQKPVSLSAYLGRITRNISINLWRKSRAQKRGGGADTLLCELSECVCESCIVESESELSELTETINKWLCSLSYDERILFLRRYWYGDSIETLARESAASPNIISGRLYRLRRKLGTILKKEGIAV